MQDSLESYVVQLLRDKGVPDSEWGTQSIEFQKVFDRVSNFIDQTVFDALSEDGKEKVREAKSTEANSDKQDDGELVERLLIENGVDPETILKDALIKFREEYLEEA